MRNSERELKTGARFFVFTTFVSGAVIMVVELLGSRIIGPSFGVSLFIWTSLITVTLVSLALGYWLGGKLADHKNSPAVLFTIILIAGLFLLMVPLMKSFIIANALYLGLRLGTLVSSSILFGPPLFLLGMVTPYIVKLSFEDKTTIGKTVGWLYAISTAGSVVGTVLTGFLLIPRLGVDNIVYLTSLILISLNATYWLFFRKQYLYLCLIIIPIVLIFIPERQPSVIREDGTKVSVKVSKDSPYGQIKVVDYSYGDVLYREFLIENIIQGGIDVNTGLSIFKYQYHLEQLAHAYANNASTALIIGLGAGVVPQRFKQFYNIKSDIAEIDEMVVKTAKEYFSFKPDKGSVFTLDGRYFLRSTNKRYDIIILDAFSGDSPPSHMVSIEAFELMRKRLSRDGVLLINFLGSNEKENTFVLSSLDKTLREVFNFVDVYVSEEYYHQARRLINFTFVAYLEDTNIERKLSIHPPVQARFVKDLEGLLDRRISLSGDAIILTDDYNPIDFYDMRMREWLRAESIKTIDKTIAVH